MSTDTPVALTALIDETLSDVAADAIAVAKLPSEMAVFVDLEVDERVGRVDVLVEPLPRDRLVSRRRFGRAVARDAPALVARVERRRDERAAGRGDRDRAVPLPSLSGLRVLRVLRPLRSLKSSPRLSRLAFSMLSALPQLGSVMVLLGFIFLIFGIVGVELRSPEVLSR